MPDRGFELILKILRFCV